MKINSMLIRLSAATFLMYTCAISSAYAADYWVSKSGNDSNGCTTATTDSCLTIQKAISLAGSGDNVNITSGTYVEDSAISPYTNKCVWMDSYYASLCINNSGTKNNPITIQAAPGDVGKVVLDSQLSRIGIHIMNSDYIHIKGLTLKNNYIIGIASWGQVKNAVPDIGRLSIGVVIDNDYIYNTGGPWGYNISGIGMWGSKDWIVKNSHIDKVYTINSTREAAGIQAYGVINALVENNYIENTAYGIFWKDHYVKDAITREPWFESEIRYNKMRISAIGVLIGIRGSNSPEAGENYIHHNIIYGLSTDGRGISADLAGASGISAPIRIEHNLIDGGGVRSISVSLDSNSSAVIKGNIFTGSSLGLELIRRTNPAKVVSLTYSDYNIFDQSFGIIADRYSANSKQYTKLSDWQSTLASQLLTLGINNPDQHSTTASARNLFSDTGSTDYKYRTSSIANNFMPDGSNAGPYQYGTEVIGGIRPMAPTLKIVN